MSTILTSIDAASFRLTINKISKLKSSRSNPVIVQDLPWQIELYRHFEGKNENDFDTLSFYLHCTSPNKSKWFCAAKAIVRLQSFKTSRSPLVNTIKPWVFCADELVWSCKGFIRWTELFDANNGYVKNDQIVVDIKISARNSEHIIERSFNLSAITENSAILSFQIANVTDLMAAATCMFDFSGLQWKIVARRNHFGDGEIRSPDGYLGIMLYCATNKTLKWKRDIFAKFTLKSTCAAPHIGSFEEKKIYSNSCRNRGFSKFILWSELMCRQNGFVENGCITFEVEIRDHSNTGDSNNNNNNNATSSRQLPLNPRIEMSCSICLDDMIGREILSSICGHIYCKACILSSIAIRPHCPNCQKRLNKKDLHPIYLPL